MKRAMFLLVLFVFTTLAPAAFADRPVIDRRPHPDIWKRRPTMRSPVEPALAKVKVQGATGGVRLEFQFAGPGECEYTLRGTQQPGGGPGPVVAKGNLTAESAGKRVLVDNVALEPEPEENVVSRYLLVALCRMKVFEQTNFGAKETEEVREVRPTSTFIILRRENVYHVTR